MLIKKSVSTSVTFRHHTAYVTLVSFINRKHDCCVSILREISKFASKKILIWAYPRVLHKNEGNDMQAGFSFYCCHELGLFSLFWWIPGWIKIPGLWAAWNNVYHYVSPVKRICVFEHSLMTNFNCACPAIQRGQGSGCLSEGSSWLTACMSEQQRFWRDCANAQARLNLRCLHRR